MQQQAGEVVAGGIHLVELKIHHVRDPRQRMPVRRIAGLECPDNSSPTQAIFYVWIFSDIAIVVEIDEIVPYYGSIESEGDCGEGEADNCQPLFARAFGHVEFAT